MLVGGNYNAVANVATLRMRNVRIAHAPHSPPLDAARSTSLMRHDRPQKVQYNLIISRTNANANWQSSNRPIDQSNCQIEIETENARMVNDTRRRDESGTAQLMGN